MNNELERWAPVPVAEYKDAYHVSNFGRVMRMITGKGTQIGRVLKASPNQIGYPVVGLSAGAKRRQLAVHRLVAMAFIGPPPTERHEVNHIDGVPTNNRACNLEWVTKSENAKHAFRIGLHVAVPMRGEMNGCNKVTEAQVKNIRSRYASGETTSALAREHGIKTQTVWRIVKRTLWAHV